jgi:hypothetical protein
MMKMIPKDLCQGKYTGGHTWDFFDEDEVCEDHHSHHHDADGHDHDDEHDKCKDDLEHHNDPVPHIDLTNLGDTDKMSPKEPYDPAQNGDDYFQVYSAVNAGDDAFVKRSDKGVDIAAWGKAKAGGSYGSMNEKLSMAESEFYYDQTNASVAEDQCYVPPCGMTWPSYREEALWNLRWRARLRRFRPPTGKAEVNIFGSGVPNLGFAKYDSGALTTFNNFATSGTASTMFTSTAVADANGAGAFIGGGTEVIH